MFLNATLCQINPVVGDINRNLNRIKSIWQKVDTQSHLVIFPELALCGYPPEDLLLRPDFIISCKIALDELVSLSKNMSSLLVLGMPYYEGDLYNALVLIGKGELLGVYKKTFLPNYSVLMRKDTSELEKSL